MADVHGHVPCASRQLLCQILRLQGAHTSDDHSLIVGRTSVDVVCFKVSGLF